MASFAIALHKSVTFWSTLRISNADRCSWVTTVLFFDRNIRLKRFVCQLYESVFMSAANSWNTE